MIGSDIQDHLERSMYDFKALFERDKVLVSDSGDNWSEAYLLDIRKDDVDYPYAAIVYLGNGRYYASVYKLCKKIEEEKPVPDPEEDKYPIHPWASEFNRAGLDWRIIRQLTGMPVVYNHGGDYDKVFYHSLSFDVIDGRIFKPENIPAKNIYDYIDNLLIIDGESLIEFNLGNLKQQGYL